LRGSDDDPADICTDNDLGAEWTGNIDCIEGARKARKGGARSG